MCIGTIPQDSHNSGCPIFAAASSRLRWDIRAHARTSATILIAATLFLASASAQTQLPAGTISADTPTQKQQQQEARTKAEAALAQQNYAEAESLLKPLTKDAIALYDLGFTYEAENKEPEAEQAYRAAIALNPDQFESHLALGLLLARHQNPAARNELFAATNRTPVTDPALKARAYRALAQVDAPTQPIQARDELLAALKLSPETPDDALTAATLAEALNAPAEADAAYKRAIALTPATDPTLAYARYLQRHDRLPEAESLLTTALAAHPNDVPVTARLASVYAAQNKFDLAIPPLESLHAALPTNTDVTRMLARIYTQNGEPQKSDPLYTALLAQTPNDPALLDDLGDNLIHQKRWAEAEAALKRALQNPNAFPTPDDAANAASHLAFAATQNNDPTVVLQALALRSKVFPDSPSSLFLGATAYDKLHQYKTAVVFYQKFLAVADKKFPDQEWQARHRIVALEHMK